MNLLKLIDIHAAYRIVFGTPEGKQVLEHICSVGFISKPTRVKGDPEQSLENEGMRRLALSILRYANIDHADIVKQIERVYTDANE